MVVAHPAQEMKPHQFLQALPRCAKALVVLVVLQTALGFCVLVALLSAGCTHQHHCSPSEWLTLATALISQLCFAGLTLQAVATDNTCQLQASAGAAAISGLLWLLFLAVVGQPMGLLIAARVGWGIAAVLLAALDVLLVRASHQHLGWRQHSWLSCDPNRKHAAERQQLRHALNSFRTTRRCCMCTLLISSVSGLVLALAGYADRRAVPTAAVPPTEGSSSLTEGIGEGRYAGAAGALLLAETGVLVTVGLHAVPLLWLALTAAAVQSGRKSLDVTATATVALAMLCPALELFFVFAYAWPQGLVVRLLLVAAPMAVWLLLMVLTWRAFRIVMGLLRQPWVLEGAASGSGSGSNGLASAAAVEDAGMQQCPPLLRPLMRGAWLSKVVHQQLGLQQNPKQGSSQMLSVLSSSLSAPHSAEATGGSSDKDRSSSGGLLGACRRRMTAMLSQQHLRFMQLSLDCSTLRWSWNKYVLLYFVEGLSVDRAQLSIVLHCVLEPDVELFFTDACTWEQWAVGLQLALQLVTGIQASMPVAPAATATAGNACTPADGAYMFAAAAVASAHQKAQPQVQAADLASAVGGSLQTPLMHQLVRTALFSQQQARQPAVRYSLRDPQAQQLQQTQAMVQLVTQQLLEVASAGELLSPDQQQVLAAAERAADNPEKLPAEPPSSQACGDTEPPCRPHTMFGGVFKIPITNPMPAQNQGAAVLPLSSSCSKNGSGGGSCSPNKHSVCLPAGYSNGSSGGSGGLMPSTVLNAGYCWSPLGAAQLRSMQYPGPAQQGHAALPANKQRQLLLWLQQQGSGGCPEPQNSPSGFSMEHSGGLDTARLLQLCSNGSVGSIQAGSPSAACTQQPQASGTPGFNAVGSNTGNAQTVPMWSPFIRAERGCMFHNGAAAGQVQQQQREQEQQEQEREQLPVTSNGYLHRSVSLPSGLETVVDIIRLRSQKHQALSRANTQVYSNSNGRAAASPDEGLQEPPQQQQQQQVLPAADPGQAVCHLANPAADSPSELQPPIRSSTPAAACDRSASPEPEEPHAKLSSVSGLPGDEQQRRWRPVKSLNAMVAAISSGVGRTRTVSIDDNISVQAVRASMAAQAEADGSAPSAATNLARGSLLLDRLSSLKSFVVGSAANAAAANKTSPIVSDREPSVRSLRSAAQRGNASFSSRPSMGRRSVSSAWQRDGSFAGARSTWDWDWDASQSSMSQITVDDGAGVPVAAAAAAPAEAALQRPDEQQQQQYLQMLLLSRPTAKQGGVLSTVHSVTAEEVQEHQQQQYEPAQTATTQPDSSAAGSHSPDLELSQLREQDAVGSGLTSAYAAAGGGIITPQAAASESKQGGSSQPCRQSWLIPSVPARCEPATEVIPAEAPATAEGDGQPAAASPVQHTSSLRVVVPPSSSAPYAPPTQLADQSEAVLTGWSAGMQSASQHMQQQQQQQEQQRMPWLLFQQQLSAAAGSMHHSPSAPQLHRDDSYVVRSPTPSQASLHSHFSHTASIASSNWWLEGCGGSPTTKHAAAQQLHTATNHWPAAGPQQAAGAPNPPASAAADSDQTLSSPTGRTAAAFHFTASALAEAALARSGDGSGLLSHASKPQDTSFRPQRKPAVLDNNKPLQVIEWSALQFGRRLGQGSEGTVLEARYLDAPVAVKEGACSSEIEMHLAAGLHDNIVSLRGLTQKTPGVWCLVMEHCGRGTLDMLLHHSKSPLARPASSAAVPASATQQPPPSSSQQQLTRPDLLKLVPLMRGAARGLLHLHNRQPPILHRDIKPANIMLGHNLQLKICDFGMARHVLPPAVVTPSLRSVAQLSSAGAAEAGGSHSRPHSNGGASGCATPKVPAVRTFTPGVVGTISYTAPEVLGVLEESSQHPPVAEVLAADIYSLGVTLWECVERERPWKDLDPMQLWAQWVADPAAVKLPPITVSPSAGDLERDVLAALQELITDCTALRPQARPSANAVLARIRHIHKMVEEIQAAVKSSSSATAG